MSSSPVTLLNTLKSQGVVFSVNKGKLKVIAPEGILTAEIKQQLAKAKPELISLLGKAPGATKSKLTVYHVVIDGKTVTALVPPGQTKEQVRQSIMARFGSDRVSSVN